MEAVTLFASKEVEEAVKKESPKRFTPAEVPNAAEVAELKGTKAVAPTPEQIIAIKVFFSLY